MPQITSRLDLHIMPRVETIDFPVARAAERDDVRDERAAAMDVEQLQSTANSENGNGQFLSIFRHPEFYFVAQCINGFTQVLFSVLPIASRVDVSAARKQDSIHFVRVSSVREIHYFKLIFERLRCILQCLAV